LVLGKGVILSLKNQKRCIIKNEARMRHGKENPAVPALKKREN